MRIREAVHNVQGGCEDTVALVAHVSYYKIHKKEEMHTWWFSESDERFALRPPGTYSP